MVRTATESDIPAIRILLKSVPGFWHEDWREDVLEHGILTADGLSFVWVDDSKIVGLVCAHDLGFVSYLSILVVAENARGREIGKHLVRQVKHELTERNCAVLISDVWRKAEDSTVPLDGHHQMLFYFVRD